MKTRTIIKDQDGGALIEFAIILPLLILVIFGIIEFSLLLFTKQIITNATREGTRLGIIVTLEPERISNQQIKNKIKDYARDYLVTFGSDTLEDDHIDIASSTGDSTDCVPLGWENKDPATTPDKRCLYFGSELKVVVTYEYKFLVLSSLPFGGFGPITLKAISTMRME